jgi:hypothetical protein
MSIIARRYNFFKHKKTALHNCNIVVNEFPVRSSVFSSFLWPILTKSLCCFCAFSHIRTAKGFARFSAKTPSVRAVFVHKPAAVPL